MHGLLVDMHGNFNPNVNTLKYSSTHPFFNLMCNEIKHLNKVFIKTSTLLLLYLENQYSIATIGLCIHEQV